MDSRDTAAFGSLIDLASQRLGGCAVAANDEFFAPKDNLLKPEPPVFIPDKYTEQGKWMDGWETRRRRSEGHDWCIVRLGLPGVIEAADIDTAHFLGNHPPFASLEACEASGERADSPSLSDRFEWREILPRSPLRAGSHNLFTVADEDRITHVRLKIFPDGGVARLRLYGRVIPEAGRFDGPTPIDLAALENGGQAVACSDMFFSPMQNLILPGPSLNMGDGWETRRRRGPGHDWIAVKLGRPGKIERVVVETSFYKGNFPESCLLEGALTRSRVDGLNCGALDWETVVPRSLLQADACHVFKGGGIQAAGPFSHLRLSIYPDGGIARLRAFGRAVPEVGEESV